MFGGLILIKENIMTKYNVYAARPDSNEYTGIVLFGASNIEEANTYIDKYNNEVFRDIYTFDILHVNDYDIVDNIYSDKAGYITTEMRYINSKAW